jgi:ATP-dependent helicase HrpB
VPLDPLPIDAHVDAVVDAVRRHRAAVVVAPPGAGKTTRLPPALAADGPVLVLQPRRVAARAIARRIAGERGWTLGQEVGWHVRFERRFTAATRVLLATEGILTARLVDDPLIADVRIIVLDEFHERSIHADLGLALARQAWAARDDLRLVVMSATLAAGPVARFLDGCPIVEVPGRPHPLDVAYAPGESVAAAVRAVWPGSRGSVLCFLPGAPEIRRAHGEVAQAVPDADVVDLFGGLTADEQDRVVHGSGRRVILATNIAETSLTVPGVDTVVDTGLHKVARYDATRALDTLDTERVSQASADQRAGRAARLGPGRARRLWDARDRLRPHGEPDIARIDLAGPLLDLAAWGTDADAFAWFEAPPAEAVAAARALLRRLGALDGGTLTPLGRRMQALPLPPRLARILIEAGGARDAARACAILSERQLAPTRREATTCDLLGSLDAWASLPPHVHQVARQIEDLAASLAAAAPSRRAFAETDLRRALFVGYADRLARRREAQGTTLVLATGTGAMLGRESGVRDGEFLVALDVQAPTRPGDRTRSCASPAGSSRSGSCRPRSPSSTRSTRGPAASARGGGSASIGWCSPSTRRRRSRRPRSRPWPKHGWRGSPTRPTPPGCAGSALPASPSICRCWCDRPRRVPHRSPTSISPRTPPTRRRASWIAWRQVISTCRAAGAPR